MVITLQDIFRDAMNSFPGNTDEFNFAQLTNWINESYVDLKKEYVQNNRHEQFSVSDVFGQFSDSSDIPYLKYAQLDRSISQQLPVRDAVISAICRTQEELTTEATTKTKGDRLWKDLDLYEAVTDVPAVDSSGLTFTKQQVRSYYPANGLKYKIGDVVYENDEAFRAIQEVTATSSDPLSGQVADWEQVYWKRVGIGFIDPTIIPLSEYDRYKSIVDSGGVVLIINRDEIYITKNVTSVYIEFVPEHEWKSEYEDTFIIPDDSLRFWRSLIHQHMYRSLGQFSGDSDES